MTITVHTITIDGSVGPAGVAQWDPDRYERAVRRNLVYIFRTPVGRVLIPQLLRRPLTIVPHPPLALDGAHARPRDAAAAQLRGATVYQCSPPTVAGRPAMGQPVPNQPRSTGVGSAVQLRYTPADWHDPSPSVYGVFTMMPTRRRAAPGALSDEVLVHELTHAIRCMRGVAQCMGVGYDYATFEEFCAVQVANVYASCRRRPVRHSYVHRDQRVALLDPFGTPTAQQRDEEAWIDRMRREQPGFCHALGNLSRGDAPYNPFRRPRSRDVRYVPQRW